MKRALDLSRGHLRPELVSKSKETDEEGGPVDASLIMSSLAIDAAPKIEDNYDYTVLDEFKASKFCPSPTRVVNTGCGGGEAAVYFAKLGYKVVGIDSDRTAVGLARERAWLAGSDVDFMVGDLFETPNLLPAESFGLAIDRGAFHRLEDDRDRQRYLANIKRLLFQGGVFLLSAGFFPTDDKSPKERKAPRGSGSKLLLAREGGVVVNELRQAGFEMLHRILRKTADSGDYGELLLYLKK
jgi:SAM-dependent methyltransferase